MEQRDVLAPVGGNDRMTGGRSLSGVSGAWYWFVFTYRPPASLVGQEERTR